MNTSRRVTVVASCVLTLTLAGAAAMLHAVDKQRKAMRAEEVLYIRSPKALKMMSLGYTGLLADLYWTRAVQYFGYQHFHSSDDLHLLGPLLEIATHLDPHLLPAYSFGSNFLAPLPPNGAGEPQRAIALAEFGIRNNPNNWKLYYDLGFTYYLELKDYPKAADAFRRGAEIPGAHPFVRILAARMAQHAGEFETSRMLWTTTYQSSKDKDIQRNAVDHLKALQVDEEVAELEKVVDHYREQMGISPHDIYDVIGAGMLEGVPVDPTGKPYKVTPDGRVELSDPDSILYVTKGLPPGKESPLPKPVPNK
jgi:tetratricopeptide (TPR) repeat protein